MENGVCLQFDLREVVWQGASVGFLVESQNVLPRTLARKGVGTRPVLPQKSLGLPWLSTRAIKGEPWTSHGQEPVQPQKSLGLAMVRYPYSHGGASD